MRTYPAALVVLIVGLALAAHTAASAPLGANYPGHDLDFDRTGDAVQALSELDFGRFFATQPSIGPGTVIVRAPFAAFAHVSGDVERVPDRLQGKPTAQFPPKLFASQQRIYRFGVFACLLCLAIMAAYAALTLARRGAAIVTQLSVAGVAMSFPLWSNAIRLGHPDEFLTAGLAFAALLAIVNGRAAAGAALFGFALASKQWVLLALPVAVWAARPAPVVKTFGIVAAVYLALQVPMVLGNPDRFADTVKHPAGAHGLVDAQTVWFPLAAHHDVRVFDGVEHRIVPRRRLPHALETAIHPAIVVLAIALALVFLRRRPDADAAALCELLALIFLLRCMLDPVTNDYYHAPFLAALALYEGFARRRLPVLAILATAAFIPKFSFDLSGFEKANALYLAWSIPMAAGLALSLYRPETAAAISRRIRLDRPIGRAR
jgi:hypothetical protein